MKVKNIEFMFHYAVEKLLIHFHRNFFKNCGLLLLEMYSIYIIGNIFKLTVTKLHRFHRLMHCTMIDSNSEENCSI